MTAMTPESRAADIVRASDLLEWSQIAGLIAEAIRDAENAKLEEAAAAIGNRTTIGGSGVEWLMGYVVGQRRAALTVRNLISPSATDVGTGATNDVLADATSNLKSKE